MPVVRAVRAHQWLKNALLFVPINIIGLGIGRVHLEGYRRQGLNVVALCDIDGDRLRDCAAKYGIEKTYSDVDALIDDPEVGIVDIAVQPGIKRPMVERAAAAYDTPIIFADATDGYRFAPPNLRAGNMTRQSTLIRPARHDCRLRKM